MVTQLGRAEPAQAQVWWLPAGLSAHPTLPLKAAPGRPRGAQESRGWPAPQWSPRPCTRCCSAHHSLLVPCPCPCSLALHKAPQSSRPGSLVLRMEGGSAVHAHTGTCMQSCAHTGRHMHTHAHAYTLPSGQWSPSPLLPRVTPDFLKQTNLLGRVQWLCLPRLPTTGSRQTLPHPPESCTAGSSLPKPCLFSGECNEYTKLCFSSLCCSSSTHVLPHKERKVQPNRSK